MEEEDERPLLLWVHYFDPHSPYDAPPDYRSLYKRDSRLEKFLEKRAIPDTLVMAKRDTSVFTPLIHNLYDAELTYLDSQFGRLIDALRSRKE